MNPHTPTIIKPFFLLALMVTMTACGGKGNTSTTSSSSSSESYSGTPCTTCTGVVINEAVSSNSEFEDEDGDAEDWLELLNNSSNAVSLAGWSLSDDPLEPDQWVFPDIQLAAQQPLLIWASKKNRAIADQPLHANLKVSSDGETLYLFDASGNLKHSLTVEGLRTGTSVGLSSKNQATVYYATPTPGAVNDDTEYAGVVNTSPTFSHAGGANSPSLVMLSGADLDQTIHYTLDATHPTGQSPQYQGAIPVSGNATIRARIFAPHFIPSVTQSRTFLPDASHDIAVITLETDPLNFFDMDFGIYVLGTTYDRAPPNEGANFWQDWEREIHFSFYEPDGSLGIEFDTGVKIFGGYTRSFAQKALAFYARGRYGVDKFEYPFFPELPYQKFENLVLRASGNDWMRTMIRDRTFTSLMAGSGVDYQAGRPVAVYLNGEYWGLHNLREKVNEHFLNAKHDIDKDEVDLLEANAEVSEGSNEDYLALIDYVTNAIPTDAEFYDTVAAQMDIENFIAYEVLQIYIANTDWPERNIKFWKTPGNKWRWILYDTDFGFGLYQNSVLDNSIEYATASSTRGESNPPWATLLLRKLIQNPQFQQQFISYFADQLNSRFTPENVATVITTLAEQIGTEIPLQSARWASGRNFWNWQNEIDQLINYGNTRPEYMWLHLQDFFDLTAPTTLSIVGLDTVAGSVLVNSVVVQEAIWSGDYFSEIPVTVTAVANPGYTFSHWSGGSDATDASLILNLDADLNDTLELTPVFIAN